MKEVDFTVPDNCDLGPAAETIETACAQLELRIAMKGTLSAYPGCVHWHYKNQNEKGTLELTLYVPKRRIWAKIQEGRKAPWIDVALPLLRKSIEQRLRSSSGPKRASHPQKAGIHRKKRSQIS